jgi:hypothetical protein
MITKEIILKKCKEAREQKSSLYIVNINNEIKFMFSKNPSWEFLKENNLSYEENLIQGLEPETVLRYDNCNDMSVNTLVEMINKKYY